MVQNDARIAVNIVAWNSMAFLPALFETLEDQTAQIRVTVVDNASNDGVMNWVSGSFPHYGMLRNMRNYGFARAHNQAIALALASWPSGLDHRYVVICNPDIELAPDCIEKMYAFMEAHPEADACCPKLLRAHLQYSDVDHKETVRTTIIDAAGMNVSRGIRAYDRGAGELDKGQYEQVEEVFGCSGACSFLRASSLARAMADQQYFDEDFFLYKEDLDVAWRMRHLGMRTFFIPQAVAWHHRFAPSQNRISWLGSWLQRRRKPTFVNYLSTRNHCWVLLKNLSGKELWHSLLWVAPYEAAKAVAALMSWSSLRGYASALMGVSKMWRKRKVIFGKAPPPFRDLSAWFV